MSYDDDKFSEWSLVEKICEPISDACLYLLLMTFFLSLSALMISGVYILVKEFVL